MEVSLESAVIYLIAVQAIVISVIASVKWYISLLYIFKQYPPSKYPLFYVFSINKEFSFLLGRVALDIAAFVSCIYFVFINQSYLDNTTVHSAWLIATVVQLLPSFYSLAVLRYSARLRQKRVKKKVKSFGMVSRSIFDHISISYLSLLVIAALLTLNIIFTNETFTLFKKVALSSLFLVTNAMLAYTIHSSISGKRHDKLLSDDDLAEKRKLDIQRSFIGMASSVVIFSLLGMNGAETIKESLWLIFPMSLFIQLATLQRTSRWHADDMDVYKAP